MIQSKIKSHFVENNQVYPKLMKSIRSDLVVMMGNQGIGVVVHPNEYHRIGVYSESWIMIEFEDFDGEITLRNK